MDGDGGLGYFASHLATERHRQGTRPAWPWPSRGITTSAPPHLCPHDDSDDLLLRHLGTRPNLEAGMPFYSSARLAAGHHAAAGDADPQVVDFAGLRPRSHRTVSSSLDPSARSRCIGLGNIRRRCGGILTGVPQEADAPPLCFASAHQAAAFMPHRFLDPAEGGIVVAGGRRVDADNGPAYSSQFAGATEADCARRYAVAGIPVGDEPAATWTPPDTNGIPRR